VTFVERFNDGCTSYAAAECVSKPVQVFQSVSANTGHRSSNDLWADAAALLSDNDRQNINFSRPDKLNILAELHADAERSKQRSIESRWKFTRKSGATVIVRDVFEKIIRWIDMFKQVGDVAVQFDPTHASLPWAGVRLVLQVRSMVLFRENATDISADCS
jgi:hypothetical protein